MVECETFYRHPLVAHVRGAVVMAKKRKQNGAESAAHLDESPRRKMMRDGACIEMKKVGRKMRQNASKVGGDIEVGSIVQVPLHNVDTTKVDGKNLTLVVVQKVVPRAGNGPAKYRLACSKGPLKNLYTRVYITPVPQGCRKVLGMDTIFETWKDKALITEREAAASTSLVGGQGKKGRCGCKGKCNTNHCCCKRDKRLCGSQCHRGLHHNCTNCTESNPI